MRIMPELYNDNNEVFIGDESVTSKDPDEAWKQFLNCIYLPGEIKEQSRTKRFVNAGICARFKFSNDRTDFILDKQKKKE